MTFSGIIYIVYFLPIVISIYYLLNFSAKLQNIFLIAASLGFYILIDIRFFVFLIFFLLINYVLGILLQHQAYKKYILYIGIIFNILYLICLKYFYIDGNTFHIGYFLTNLTPTLLITLGISFYVLLAISYLLDIYKGKIKSRSNFLVFCLYITFFPKVIYGPLIEYIDFEQQFYNRKTSIRLFSTGVCRLVKGMAKKWIIADTLAIVTNQAFSLNNEQILPLSLAWLGIVSYGLQFYFDFSGLCDMAIGVGYILGFKLPENFNYPFAAKSLQEFWQCWHITLVNWFKKNIYFSLGGSKVKNKDFLVRNLFIVFVLLGLWHGLNSIFIVWAIYNFVFTLIEILFEWEKKDIPDIYRRLFLFLFLIGSGVLFESPSLLAAKQYFAGLAGCGGIDMQYAIRFLNQYLIYYIIAGIFCLPVSRRMNTLLVNNIFKDWYSKLLMSIYPLGMLLLFIAAVSYLLIKSEMPSMYFGL